MMEQQIKRGNLIRIPQSSILYEHEKNTKNSFKHFLAVKEIKQPQIGIYLSSLDEDYSEIIIEDKIFVAANNNIFLYKEEKNAR